MPNRQTGGSVLDTGSVNMATGEPQEYSVKAEHIDLPDGHWTYWMFPIVKTEQDGLQEEGQLFPMASAELSNLPAEQQIFPVVKAEHVDVPEEQLYSTLTEGVDLPEQFPENTRDFEWTELPRMCAIKTEGVNLLEQRQRCNINTSGTDLPGQMCDVNSEGIDFPEHSTLGMLEKVQICSVPTTRQASQQPDEMLITSNSSLADFPNRSPMTRDQAVQTVVESYTCRMCQRSFPNRKDTFEYSNSSRICESVQTAGDTHDTWLASVGSTRNPDTWPVSAGFTKGHDTGTVSAGSTRDPDARLGSVGSKRDSDTQSVSVGSTRAPETRLGSDGCARDSDTQLVSIGSTRDPETRLGSDGCARDSDTQLVSVGSTRDPETRLGSDGCARDSDTQLVSVGSTRDPETRLGSDGSTRDSDTQLVSAGSTRDPETQLVSVGSARAPETQPVANHNHRHSLQPPGDDSVPDSPGEESHNCPPCLELSDGMSDCASSSHGIPGNGDIRIKDVVHKNIHMSALCQSEFKRGSKAQKKKKHSRVFNKCSSCLFCHRLYTNISKHYICHHKDELKVSEILAQKDSGQHPKRIKAAWELLRNEGNHEHNRLVNASKTGELLVVRRQHCESFSIDDYTPCPLCKGWFLKTALTMHVKHRCVLKTMENERSSTIHRKSHVHKFDRQTDKLDSQVFLKMLTDILTETAEKDDIIRRVGMFYSEKHHHNSLGFRNSVSKHMRQAARLLLQVRRLDGSSGDLSSYLKPEKFNIFCQAAIKLAGGHREWSADLNLRHPSTLRNIGYEIKHYVDIKEELANENKNFQQLKDCKDFLELFKNRWGLLSSSAQRQLEERQHTSEMTTLPTSEDIRRVTDYIKNCLTRLDKQGSLSGHQYKDVVKLVETRLTLFNKCLPGELESLRLDDLTKRSNSDLLLSELEKHLVVSHEVVTVGGESDRPVPVLIPPDTLPSLVKLTDPKLRKDAGVKPSNPYVFANTGSEVHRCLQSAAHVLRQANCPLDVCKLVKTSSLRQYMAASCQLLDVSVSELDWVNRHLEPNKLSSNCRPVPATMERTKLAKLLVIAEMGLMEDVQNSSLSDEDLDDLLIKKTGDHPQDLYGNGDAAETDDDCMGTDTTSDVEESEYNMTPSSGWHSGVTEGPPCKVAKICRRNKPWGNESVELLMREFRVELQEKRYPSFMTIRKVQRSFPKLLAGRSEAQVKSKLGHIMKLRNSVPFF